VTRNLRQLKKLLAAVPKETKMETVWIQVFVLTLTQCIAPSGKMICQEEAVQYQFLNKTDCEHALVLMTNVASGADNVIVNKENSHCRPAAVESMAFNNVDEANAKYGNAEGWRVLGDENQSADFTQSAHQDRLKNLHECGDVANVPPCKVGQIIIEASVDGPSPEIWHQRN